MVIRIINALIDWRGELLESIVCSPCGCPKCGSDTGFWFDEELKILYEVCFNAECLYQCERINYHCHWGAYCSEQGPNGECLALVKKAIQCDYFGSERGSRKR